MNKRILVVDDDYGTLKLLELILKNNGYEAVTFNNPTDALRSFFSSRYDAIVSDFYMPVMTGGEFLEEVRIKDKFIPFIVLTSSKDLEVAVELMKKEADDYIAKPVVKEDFLFRIEKTIRENANKRIIDQIEKEKEITLLENKRLTDWKQLYASKDSKQSENLIELFNRTLNEGGGFSWLELLKKEMKKNEDGSYSISSDIADLIIKTSERHQSFFNNIAYIASINSLNLEVEKISYHNFVKLITQYCHKELVPLAKKYGRKILIQESSQLLEAELVVCIKYINKIMKELVINAIKYSPDETSIYIMLDRNPETTHGTFVDVVIKNTPRTMNTRKSDFERNFSSTLDTNQGLMSGLDDVIMFDTDEVASNDSDVVLFGDDDNLGDIKSDNDIESYDHILGIPYEYSELVFDLFYTIEPFPVELDEEEWRGGTGLYIVRKIVNRHKGVIRNANGIDYSLGDPTPFVKFGMSLPYRKTV